MPSIGLVAIPPIHEKSGVISQDFDEFIESLTVNKFDEEYKKYTAKLKADGMDEYISSVRKQWEEYNK